MGRKNYKIVALLLVCSWLLSCSKDKPAQPASAGNGSVYVVCEGALGNGDASLYVYNSIKDSVYGDIYSAINKQPLGDVFQSISRIGSSLFLCINNSNKIVVINAATLQLEGTIAVHEPRYILPVSNTKAYVSTLFSNQIYIINPQTLSVTGSINMPYQNAEKMLLYGDKAFVCAWDTGTRNVYRLDTHTDLIDDSIKTAGYAPQEILLDKEQNVWVLSGNAPKGKNCAFTCFDPSTGNMLRSYSFPIDADPVRPVLNNAGDSLYFIEANYNGGTQYNGIFRMGIHDAAIPAGPFIPAHANQYFWALGIDPKTGYIFVGDPMGFIQKGTIYVYRTDGSLVNQFKVGLGPGHFFFDE